MPLPHPCPHTVYTRQWHKDELNICFGLPHYKLFVALVKTETKSNRVINTLTLCFSFPGSGCGRPSRLPLCTALTSPLWQQGEKDRKKRKRFDNMAHFPWEKFLLNATQLCLCGFFSQFIDTRTSNVDFFGDILNISWRFNSRLKVNKECDGMRAITRRTNQSSQTGWRGNKRLWKKR